MSSDVVPLQLTVRNCHSPDKVSPILGRPDGEYRGRGLSRRQRLDAEDESFSSGPYPLKVRGVKLKG